MTDFSQESGRAGRDGEPAKCMILAPRLPASAAARAAALAEAAALVGDDPDRASMLLYLSEQHCLRAVIS
jgi:superfamily II DNA helicase RecQ